MLDIDHFKRINDAYGHQGGDRVLVELGELLRAQTRAADIACRLGGEEFLLLFPDMPARIAIDCAERLRLAFAALQMCIRDRHPSVRLAPSDVSYPERSTGWYGS